MNKELIIEKTADYMKSKLSGEGSGHDWWHVYRVWKNAIHIAKNEKADLFVVELAALLHDISDWKFNDGDEDVGPKLAGEWLANNHVDAEIINHVCEIIKEMSFKGAKVKKKMRTIEGMIVQDADRLDAIGAIGIARTFAYGGNKNNEMHNPEVKPNVEQTSDEYKKGNASTINHFYEKLLLLKDLMNTKTARQIAEDRHKFMEQYLEQFYEEWEGKK